MSDSVTNVLDQLDEVTKAKVMEDVRQLVLQAGKTQHNQYVAEYITRPESVTLEEFEKRKQERLAKNPDIFQKIPVFKRDASGAVVGYNADRWVSVMNGSEGMALVSGIVKENEVEGQYYILDYSEMLRATGNKSFEQGMYDAYFVPTSIVNNKAKANERINSIRLNTEIVSKMKLETSDTIVRIKKQLQILPEQKIA